MGQNGAMFGQTMYHDVEKMCKGDNPEAWKRLQAHFSSSESNELARTTDVSLIKTK